MRQSTCRCRPAPSVQLPGRLMAATWRTEAMMEYAPSGMQSSSNCCSRLQSHLVRSYTVYAGPLLAVNLSQLPEKRPLSGRFVHNQGCYAYRRICVRTTMHMVASPGVV